MDTIYALSSGSGKAGVAVIRISGPSAFQVCESIAGFVPKPRAARLAWLKRDDDVLDQALILTFEDKKSFTGEPVVEFHVHGSTAVVSAVLSLIGSFPGCRAAQAGEFTRRALENDRLDLAQVEGLADLLESETEAQRKLAQRNFSGELSRQCDRWRAHLIRALALIEVTIDFADEDVPDDLLSDVLDPLNIVISELEEVIGGFEAAERIRTGFEVAILGRPNAGKSTLLNRLAGRDAAITSEIAGTTRDVIEVRMDIDGLPVTVLDTAGLRESNDAIEAMGIQRALDRAESSDLRVYLAEENEKRPSFLKPEDLFVKTKIDLSDNAEGISGLTGQGVSALVAKIAEKLSDVSASAGLVSRERHRQALISGRTVLLTAREALLNHEKSGEFLAEDVRSGIHALDSLVGRVDIEAVLGEIFQSFCIGK